MKFSTQIMKILMHDVSSSEQIKFQSQKFLILLWWFIGTKLVWTLKLKTAFGFEDKEF